MPGPGVPNLRAKPPAEADAGRHTAAPQALHGVPARRAAVARRVQPGGAVVGHVGAGARGAVAAAQAAARVAEGGAGGARPRLRGSLERRRGRCSGPLVGSSASRRCNAQRRRALGS